MTRILHLSDTHVSATGTDMDGVDAIAALDRILLNASHVPDVDAVVVSGDIADDGSAEGCDAVLERVGAFAAARGIPHIYSTGNYDARSAFRKVLGSGHLNPDGSDRGRSLDDGADRCGAISHVGGLRVITLDSLVPDRRTASSTPSSWDDFQTSWHHCTERNGPRVSSPAASFSVGAIRRQGSSSEHLGPRRRGPWKRCSRHSHGTLALSSQRQPCWHSCLGDTRHRYAHRHNSTTAPRARHRSAFRSVTPAPCDVLI